MKIEICFLYKGVYYLWEPPVRHEKNNFGYEYVVGHKEFVWTMTTCTVFQLIASRYHIHTNLVWWVCSVTLAMINTSNRFTTWNCKSSLK